MGKKARRGARAARKKAGQGGNSAFPGWRNGTKREERQMNMAHPPDDPKGKLDPRRYRAYGIDKQRQKRLSILPVAGNTHMPSYDALMPVVPDDDSETRIELVYSHMRVKIMGRNLQGLIAAIRERTCSFIQEYHPNQFSPPDADMPVITRIEIVMCEEMELLLAKDKTRH